MKISSVTVLATCLWVASWAAAADVDQAEAWNRHTGPYVEAGVGTGFSYLGVLAQDFDPSGSAVRGFSWVGSAGYSFTTHHAVETGFAQWYTTFEDDDVVEDREVDGHLNVGYVAWRGTLFVQDRSSFFFKLGAMAVSVPETETDDAWAVVPFTGVGFSYAVTPQIDLSLQYQGGVYVVASAGALTLGAGYHF
jgi:hypothetical protein